MASAALHHVTIHGHDVTYRKGGEGSAILLIHGMAGSSRTWKEVTELLVPNHTVIAPDLLGHGESAKPMGDYSLGAFASGLRDLMGVIGVDRCTVVGQSLGGGVAMQLAYQHPELVERLVLVCSGGLGREVSWLLRLLTLPGAELVMPVIMPRVVADKGNDVNRFLHRRGIRAPHLGEMWRAYASLSGAENRGRVPAYAPRSRRPWRPERVGARPDLPGQRHAHHDHLGRGRPDHPHRARLRRPRDHRW